MSEYIDREAALAFMNEVEPCICKNAVTGEIFSATKDKDMIAFLSAIPAADVRPVEWIPVTERLPDQSGIYLAWMRWDVTEAEEEPSAYPVNYDAEEEAFGWWNEFYDSETLGWSGEDFIRYDGITHWMPLPEPPKEETK